MTTVEEETELNVLSQMASEIFHKLILGTFKSRSEYGDSWRKRRLPYFTERMASKMMRIRNLENNAMLGIPAKNEGIAAEFKDVICYGLMGLIKLGEIGDCPCHEDDPEAVIAWARKYFGIRED